MFSYIISGKYKGRKIFIPKTNIRPTTNLVREALFSIIGNNIEGKSFLDVFAGSGIIGIEALSRGASYVTFVDLNRIATNTIKRNLNNIFHPNEKNLSYNILDIYNKMRNNKYDNNKDLKNSESTENNSSLYKIFNIDFRKFFKINIEKFDYIFFSPPYFENFEDDILNCLIEYKPLKEDGTAIVQIFKKIDLNLENKNLIKIDERRYGITKLIFLKYKN
ncbi:MAG: RsmD family RNA methyltransferase [Spirochaetes bacterium]|nr:RsmD family RNA methyltransferase [Spirochaetota bacterium]